MKKIHPAAVLTAFLLCLAACGTRPSGAAPAAGGPADALSRDSKQEVQATTDPGRGAPVSDATGPDTASLLMTTRLPDLLGAVNPLAAHKGRSGILLAFVDTKCPFSNVAIRELPKVASVLETHDIPSLLVNIGESEAAVKKTYALDVPVVYDTGKATQNRWDVRSVPTIVLLDSAGSVTYKGAAAWAGVATATEKMLNLAAGSVRLDQAQSTLQG